jgi:hypothetical protein
LVDKLPVKSQGKSTMEQIDKRMIAGLLAAGLVAIGVALGKTR